MRGLFSNPVIVALLLGFTWNLLSLPVPAPVNELTRLLGQAATPCALFATGAALSQYRIAGNLAESLWLVSVKIILQPLLVWLLAAYVFQLPPLWSAVAVLIAALWLGQLPSLTVIPALLLLLAGLAMVIRSAQAPEPWESPPV